MDCVEWESATASIVFLQKYNSTSEGSLKGMKLTFLIKLDFLCAKYWPVKYVHAENWSFCLHMVRIFYTLFCIYFGSFTPSTFSARGTRVCSIRDSPHKLRKN